VIQTLDVSGTVTKLFLSPDGERLFVIQEDHITAYNLSTWVKQGDDIYCGTDFSFGISPEGSQIYLINNSCFGGTCKSFFYVVDAATLQTLKTIQLENGAAGTNGNFVGRIANTVSGQITLNGTGFSGGGKYICPDLMSIIQHTFNRWFVLYRCARWKLCRFLQGGPVMCLHRSSRSECRGRFGN